METDDELRGEGNSYTTMFRQYDPRIGRWLSLDPKTSILPSSSPYVFAGNKVIDHIDPNGDIEIKYSAKKRTNSDGTTTMVVTVTAYYEVVNLSSSRTNDVMSSLAAVKKRADKDFDHSTSENSDLIDGIDNWEIDFTIHFSSTSTSYQIPASDVVHKGDNVLLVVDAANSPASTIGDKAGWAQIGGSIALVEDKYMMGPLFTTLVLHEIGHNMGFQHVDGDKKNVMFPFLETEMARWNSDQSEFLTEDFSLDFKKDGDRGIKGDNSKGTQKKLTTENLLNFLGKYGVGDPQKTKQFKK